MKSFYWITASYFGVHFLPRHSLYAETLPWPCTNSVGGCRAFSRIDHGKPSSACGPSFWFRHPHQHASTAPSRTQSNWRSRRSSALQPSVSFSPSRRAVAPSTANLFSATLCRVAWMQSKCWWLDWCQCWSETGSLRPDVRTSASAQVHVFRSRQWSVLFKRYSKEKFRTHCSIKSTQKLQLSINQSTNQSFIHSINHSINQSINEIDKIYLLKVASLGGGARPRWHPRGGWHPKEKNFVGKFTKNSGETRSDR